MATGGAFSEFPARCAVHCANAKDSPPRLDPGDASRRLPVSRSPSHDSGRVAAPGLSPALTWLFAVACGLCVANIYFAQPLLGPIALSLNLHAGLAGLIMTLTQLGYGLGLLLIVPLADVIENRRLVAIGAGGHGDGAGRHHALDLGCRRSWRPRCWSAAGAVAAQVLVPFASHLAPEATRGKVVGNIMAGLLAGIMLARPFSSIVAAALGWRAVFAISAVPMDGVDRRAVARCPGASPHASVGYARTMASLPGIVWRTPVLRRRGLYQGMMFSSFQTFWTAVPLLLAHEFGMGQGGIMTLRWPVRRVRWRHQWPAGWRTGA